MTRFVLISDTHTMHNQLVMPEGDVLLHAGDISYQGKPHELASFNAWLETQKYEQIIMVPGNHDLLFEKDFNLAKSLVPEALVLDQQSEWLDQYHIYGEPRQIEFFNWAYNVRAADMQTRCWDKVPPDVDILLTHGPPYGIGDLTRSGDHVGCRALKAWIEAHQPSLVVCGHIHEGYGKYQLGNTLIVNASSCTANYKPTNPPIVVDLP